MRRKEPISKIMTKAPVSVQIGQPLSLVRKLLAENSFHHIPVLDRTKLVGILSSSDIVKYTLEAYGTDPQTSDQLLDSQFSTAHVMNKSLMFLTKDQTVRDAAQLLNTGSFHSLLVVDNAADRNLVGIVTTTDLIRFLTEVLKN